MGIHILDSALVGRIAAGEVVERPASAAKELIENALDAGATAISIELREGGLKLLRVTDNGCGIPASEVRLAFANHATSKLTGEADLSDIRTLGFRGEALPSIAAVSHVTLTTRTRHSDVGTVITVRDGQITGIREAGCPEGTTIAVEDLFSSVPARRNFLKKPHIEAAYVSDMVSKLILSNPDVSIRLMNNGKLVYHSAGDGQVRHAAMSIYGRALAGKLTQIDAALGGIALSGLIGVGECTRANRREQVFSINGRVVNCAALTRALENATRGRVMIGKFPMCALRVKLPPGMVDVNVHPNKLEIRLRDEDSLQGSFEALISRAFEGERVLELEPRQGAEMPGAAVIARVEVSGDGAAARDQGTETPSPGTASGGVGLGAAQGGAPGATKEATPGYVVVNNLHRPGPSLAREAGGVGIMPDGARTGQEIGHDASDAVGGTTSGDVSRGIRPEWPLGDQRESDRTVGESVADSPAIEQRTQGESLSGAMPGLPAGDPSGAFSSGNHSGIIPGSPASPLSGAMPGSPAGAPTAGIPGSSAPQKAEQLTLAGDDDASDFRPEVSVLGVAFETYIIVQVDDVLMLIDQHAAHERVLYERMNQTLGEGGAAQQLLTPIIVPLSPRERALALSQTEALGEIGFEVEPFGERDIQVRSVPHVLGAPRLTPFFAELLDRASQLKSATHALRREMLIQSACKHAVKAGDRLSMDEIHALLDIMLKTGAPPTCPHGRPVMEIIRKSELERKFKRIV